MAFSHSAQVLDRTLFHTGTSAASFLICLRPVYLINWVWTLMRSLASNISFATMRNQQARCWVKECHMVRAQKKGISPGLVETSIIMSPPIVPCN